MPAEFFWEGLDHGNLVLFRKTKPSLTIHEDIILNLHIVMAPCGYYSPKLDLTIEPYFIALFSYLWVLCRGWTYYREVFHADSFWDRLFFILFLLSIHGTAIKTNNIPFRVTCLSFFSVINCLTNSYKCYASKVIGNSFQ